MIQQTPKTQAAVYSSGNSWQRKVYRAMSLRNEYNPLITAYGVSRNGNKYKHLLTTEQSAFNFVTENIYNATLERFSRHKAGDLNRILTNTAASQPYCFNLMIHLQQNPVLASKLFSTLLGKDVNIIHIEPEFTPNVCDNIPGFERTADESIGDQQLKLGIGTDADIAIFYTYDNNRKGVLLIEFKFIESEFSICSSFSAKQSIRSICSSVSFFKELVSSGDLRCGYNKYINWQLTERSALMNVNKIRSLPSCPFRNGLNQLWRNMLLTEQVGTARNCDEKSFWVFSPAENDDFLWKKGAIETQFRSILSEQGNQHFRKIHLETILDELRNFVTDKVDVEWLSGLEQKYRI